MGTKKNVKSIKDAQLRTLATHHKHNHDFSLSKGRPIMQDNPPVVPMEAGAVVN